MMEMDGWGDEWATLATGMQSPETGSLSRSSMVREDRAMDSVEGGEGSEGWMDAGSALWVWVWAGGARLQGCPAVLHGTIVRDGGAFGRSGLAFVTGSGTAGVIPLLWLATPLALLVNPFRETCTRLHSVSPVGS